MIAARSLTLEHCVEIPKIFFCFFVTYVHVQITLIRLSSGNYFSCCCTMSWKFGESAEAAAGNERSHLLGLEVQIVSKLVRSPQSSKKMGESGYGSLTTVPYTPFSSSAPSIAPLSLEAATLPLERSESNGALGTPLATREAERRASLRSRLLGRVPRPPGLADCFHGRWPAALFFLALVVNKALTTALYAQQINISKYFLRPCFLV